MKIKRIIASDFIATVLSSALNIYMYWFAYQHFSNQSMIAILGFGQLSGIFLSTLGGGISDRVNKLYFIKLLKFLKVLLLALVWLLYGSVDLEILLPLFMLCSTLIGSLLSPTLESLLPFLSDNDEELFRNNSIVTSLTQVATIVSIILSAVYISFFSFTVIIFVSQLLSVISFMLLHRISIETPLQSNSVIQAIQKGLQYIFMTSYIRNLIPIALMMNFSFWSIFLLLPKITSDNFSFLNISYSILELFFAFGGVVGGWIFTKYLFSYKDKYKLFNRTLFYQSLVLLLLGFDLLVPNRVLSYSIMLFLWFLYALFNTIFSIVYFGNLQIKVPRNIIGSVFGSVLTIFSLVNPLAAIVSGYLVSIFPIPLLIILLSLMMLVGAFSVHFLPSLKTTFD